MTNICIVIMQILHVDRYNGQSSVQRSTILMWLSYISINKNYFDV